MLGLFIKQKKTIEKLKINFISISIGPMCDNNKLPKVLFWILNTRPN